MIDKIDNNRHLKFDPFMSYKYIGEISEVVEGTTVIKGWKKIPSTGIEKIPYEIIQLMTNGDILLEYFWDAGRETKEFGYFILNSNYRPIYHALLYIS